MRSDCGWSNASTHSTVRALARTCGSFSSVDGPYTLPMRSTCALQCWPPRSLSALTSAAMPGRTAPTKLSLSSARTIRGFCGSRVNSGPDAGDTLAPGCADTRTTSASNGASRLRWANS